MGDKMLNDTFREDRNQAMTSNTGHALSRSADCLFLRGIFKTN